MKQQLWCTLGEAPTANENNFFSVKRYQQYYGILVLLLIVTTVAFLHKQRHIKEYSTNALPKYTSSSSWWVAAFINPVYHKRFYLTFYTWLHYSSISSYSIVNMLISFPFICLGSKEHMLIFKKESFLTSYMRHDGKHYIIKRKALMKTPEAAENKPKRPTHKREVKFTNII